MVARGRVEKGVVVVIDGVRLPEGQEVTVLAPPESATSVHGILEIPTFSVGQVLSLSSADDDLLGEMLEGHQ
jgi:hypothetical protein